GKAVLKIVHRVGVEFADEPAARQPQLLLAPKLVKAQQQFRIMIVPVLFHHGLRQCAAASTSIEDPSTKLKEGLAPLIIPRLVSNEVESQGVAAGLHSRTIAN